MTDYGPRSSEKVPMTTTDCRGPQQNIQEVNCFSFYLRSLNACTHDSLASCMHSESATRRQKDRVIAILYAGGLYKMSDPAIDLWWKGKIAQTLYIRGACSLCLRMTLFKLGPPNITLLQQSVSKQRQFSCIYLHPQTLCHFRESP